MGDEGERDNLTLAGALAGAFSATPSSPFTSFRALRIKPCIKGLPETLNPF